MEQRQEDSRLARARRVVTWSALGLYALFCLALWVGQEWYPEWDSALYLLTARALSEGDGYRYLGEPFFLRPPGFAALLAPFWSGGALALEAVLRAMMACAAGAVVAVHLALRAGGRPWLALAVALLVGTSPLYVSAFNWVQSELPFTLLLFLAIGALQRGLRAGRRWPLWSVAGAVLLAAAVHVRSFGLLLLPALALVAWRERRRGGAWRALLPLGLTAMLALPWTLHARALAAAAPTPSEQLYLHDYTTALLHEDPGDPDSAFVGVDGWLERVRSNGAAIASDLASTVLGTDAAWAALALVALLVFGLVAAVRAGPALVGWFGAFGLGVLLVYFTYVERLLLPLLPCVYLALLLAVGRLARGHLATLLAVALLLALNLARLPDSLRVETGDPEREVRAMLWRDLRETGAWLRAETPADAVILCDQAPVLSLLSNRRCVTYRFDRVADPIAKHGADYVVFDAEPPAGLRELAAERLDQLWRLPSAWPGATIDVVRVR